MRLAGDIRRLALGTVQFGLPYGVANRTGQVCSGEAAAIILQAKALGLDTLDTAMAYGDSETKLGEIGVSDWQVVTKLSPPKIENADIMKWMRDSVDACLQRLKTTHLRGVLLHRPQQLLEPHGDELYAALQQVKDEGKVEKIGISIYGPDELDALANIYSFDLVQAPYNIMDRRLVASGWLDRLQKTGTEVHIRSIFLQGLLLMKPAARPTRFSRWQALWQQWDQWLAKEKLTALQACLGFVFSEPSISRVIIGVQSLVQFHEIVENIGLSLNPPPSNLFSDDIDLINPSRWNAT